MADHPLKNLSFVDQVGKALGVFLFAKFRARILAFEVQLPGYSRAQSFEPRGVDHSRKYEIPFDTELANVFLRHYEEHCSSKAPA
jgi:hypothetical protein